MTTKDTTNFPRALLADAFNALHSEIPLTPGSLLHAAIGEACRQVQLARCALALGELLPRDLEAIRRLLTIADDFAKWLAYDEEDERGQSAAEPPADALRKAVDLCNDEIIDDIATALGRLEDARRARPDADPQPILDQAVMESHNAVTAAFRKLGRSLRSADRVQVAQNMQVPCPPVELPSPAEQLDGDEYDDRCAAAIARAMAADVGGDQ